MSAPGSEHHLGTVLFVDDEPAILRALGRAFSAARFKVLLATTAADAIRILENSPIDVVVADIRMPGVDGIELLSTVRDRFPTVGRVILSGQADRETVLGALNSGVGRTFLSKPWDDDALRDRLDHLILSRRELVSQGLLTLLAQVDHLPAVPRIYAELEQAIREKRTLAQIAHIIEGDVGLSGKVLQIINSALYSRSGISSVERAIALLGVESVRTITLMTSFVEGTPWPARLRGMLDELVGHAVLVQRSAVSLLRPRFAHLADDAGTAGLFHDVGQILLLRHLPDRFRATSELMDTKPSMSFLDAETALGFGDASHARIGAYLLDSWNLPEVAVKTALHHHSPDRYNGVGSLVVQSVGWVERAMAAARRRIPLPPPPAEIAALADAQSACDDIARAVSGDPSAKGVPPRPIRAPA
jgi:HD-like signal output (HDOD) protein